MIEGRRKNVPQNTHEPCARRVLELWQRIQEVERQKGNQHEREHIVLDVVVGADYETNDTQEPERAKERANLEQLLVG